MTVQHTARQHSIILTSDSSLIKKGPGRALGKAETGFESVDRGQKYRCDDKYKSEDRDHIGMDVTPVLDFFT